MKKVIIKVGSVTYAMKAKNILQQYGMRAKVIKTVSTKKNEGCGYSVSIENPKLYVAEYLRREGFTVSEMKRSQVYHAREIIADFFDLPQCENVIFTKNCTEALNTAIKGLAKRGGHFVCSDLEHNAVVRPLEALRLQGICTWTAAAVGGTDEQTVENFQKCLRPNTIAIVCTGASNVFGKTLPLRALASLAHRHGVLLVADTAQSAGILPISMQKDGIDFLCAPGHKGLYGPQGSVRCNGNRRAFVQL